MRKVVIKISQGSVVAQTVLGGLTIHLPVANFLCFISAKNYWNWLRVDKVIAMNTVCSFFGPPCIICCRGFSASCLTSQPNLNGWVTICCIALQCVRVDSLSLYTT